MNVMTISRFTNRVLLAATLVALGAACSWAAEPTAMPDDSRANEFDRRLISLTYELVRTAAGEGNPPFSAILVHGDSIVLQVTNTGRTTGDVTRHAETGLISDASRKFGREFLSECCLYASSEPCVMCAGAIRWAGIPRVVYGTPQNLHGRFQEIPCREVLARIAPEIEVVGPVMQEEGAKLRSGFHKGGWKGGKDWAK